LTRERLLSAAAGLFAERGVNGASVEQIAERAGYTRGAFYGNFAGKPELVAALLEQRTRAEYDELTALTVAAESATAAENALRAWHLRRAEHDQTWLSLRLELLLYAAREQADVYRRLRERERFARQAHATALERLFAERGTTPPADLAQLALIVHALEDGLLIQRSLDPEAVPAEAMVDAVAVLSRAWLALAKPVV
jgi:AcrR family transcriptional regulator